MLRRPIMGWRGATTRCVKGVARWVWHVLPGSLVIHGKMPPLPSWAVLPDDLTGPFFAGAFFAAAFFGGARAIIETAARESATLDSCMAGVKAPTLRNAKRCWNGGGVSEIGGKGGVKDLTPPRDGEPETHLTSRQSARRTKRNIFREIVFGIRTRKK